MPSSIPGVKELNAIIADLPAATAISDPELQRRLWQRWQQGLQEG